MELTAEADRVASRIRCGDGGLRHRPEHQRRYGSKTEAARKSFFVDRENPAPEWFGIGQKHQ
jgi:hypothetical protein